MPRHPHFLLVDSGAAARFTSTRSGRAKRFNTPPRNRAQHGAQIVGAFQNALAQREHFPQNIGNGFYQSPGLTLTFESEPQFPLAFESLDLAASKIQLLSVVLDAQNRTIATVHVPDDKVPVLLRKIEAYRDFNPQAPQGRENKKLVESISNIKLATLRELWTDDPALYPAANTTITWEVWLRRALAGEDAALARLVAGAPDVGYVIASNALTFVDRTVVLVRGTREQLSRGADVLGVIAEVRKAKVTTDFFAALDPSQQHDWSDELLARLTAPPAGAPAVGLLDTGVNHGHPLLAPVIADGNVQTLRPAWGVHDGHQSGHGTQMAGLAIYGNLAPVLSDIGPIALTHGVQSLKLIQASQPHAPELYGTVTIEGVSRLEIDTTRQRVYCLAITADARDRGRPSSWSAAIDNLAFGAINDTRRLILISAGNTELAQRGA